MDKAKLEDLRKRVEEEAQRFEFMAEFEARIADLFEPDYRACWETREDGSMGRLVDLPRCMALRPYNIDARANAKRAAEQAADLRALLSALEVSHG